MARPSEETKSEIVAITAEGFKAFSRAQCEDFDEISLRAAGEYLDAVEHQAIYY